MTASAALRAWSIRQVRTRWPGRRSRTGELTPLIRALIVSVREADGAVALAIRAVPLAAAAPDASTRKLVDALVKARLVTWPEVRASPKSSASSTGA